MNLHKSFATARRTRQASFQPISAIVSLLAFLPGVCAVGSFLTAQAAMAHESIGAVFVIDMENHNFTQPSSDTSAPQQIFGNPAAPYLNSLITPGHPNAAQVSYASAYLGC